MVQIAKFLALMLSILSLCMLFGHAFLVAGQGWEDRLIGGLSTLGMTASVCFASGLIFEIPDRKFDPEPTPTLLRTLPVQLFFWGVGLMAVLWVLAWFLAVDFVPMMKGTAG